MRLFADTKMIVLALILVVVGVGSLSIGVYHVPPATTARIVLSLILPANWGPEPTWTADELAVIQLIRLPRIFLVALCGASLAMSGAALQGVMRNPLVGPDIVGVSAGAACGGSLAIMLGLSDVMIVTMAFAGGLAGITLSAALASLVRAGSLGLILSGVIVGAFASAVLGLLQYLADPSSSLPQMIYWLLGSFSGADRVKVAIVASALALGGSVLLVLRWQINLLSLGDEAAKALRVRVGLLRWLIIVSVSLLVAAQVSVSGIVGWVGLIIPHLARVGMGADHRRLLPAAMFIGSIFLLLADDVVRSVDSVELPIGLVTAIVGTPAFAFVFWRLQKKGLHNA